MLCVYTDFKNYHGRIEYRDCYIFVIHLLLITMKNEKVYQLTMIWIMRCCRREKSKITVKEQYYIIRKEINIKAFRDANRCRWN